MGGVRFPGKSSYAGGKAMISRRNLYEKKTSLGQGGIKKDPLP